MRRPTITLVTPWHAKSVEKRRELERGYFQAVGCVDAEVLIVDDRSTPPLPNALISRGKGFGKTCNTGLFAARTDAVVFLNNDIVAHARDWLEPIRELLDYGVFCGPDLIDSPHGAVDGQSMPYIDGWCFAGMTEDLLELDGFDETFEPPAYYEDNDLSFRARVAGISLKEARRTRFMLEHLRNRTIGVPNDPETRRVTLANKARFEARVRAELGVAA